MSIEFSIREMTCFENAEDGSSVRLDMRDNSGRPVSLHMPVECLNRLVMTLPAMLKRAMQKRHRDPTLRLVYPVAHFQMELASDLDTRILTLATADGFSVSFSLSEEQCENISMKHQIDRSEMIRAN